MSRMVCPYCYSTFSSRELWFQCSQRTPDGRMECRWTVDENRTRLTGYQAPMPISFPPPNGWTRRTHCPECGADTGARACPRCHSPLPTGFGDSGSTLIACVGPRGAGKTVFLTVLMNHLRSRMSHRFEADIHMIDSGDDGYTDYLGMLSAGRLPRMTETSFRGNRVPLVVAWRSVRRTGRFLRHVKSCFLSFYDTAGEDMSSTDRAYLQRYITAASAIIAFVDPLTIPQASDHISVPLSALMTREPAEDTLFRLTDTLRMAHGLRTRDKIKTPIAIVLTKMDEFFDVLGSDSPLLRPPPEGPWYDEKAGQRTHEQVGALLHGWGAQHIEVHLRHNFTTFRFFAVSALGAAPDYDAATTAPHGIRPFRVDEPITWLLSRFGVVATSRN